MGKADLQGQIRDFMEGIDSYLHSQDALGDISIVRMADGLLSSVTANGEVSYIVGAQARYRCTPLASVLEALHDVNLLPPEAVAIMQNQLMEYKDNFKPLDPNTDDIVKKQPEDCDAWSIDEGPSVWTTSKTIFALLKTGFAENLSPVNKETIRKAVLWLINQAESNDKNATYCWGYQKYPQSDDCKPTIAMTCLAMQALAEANANKNLIFPKSDKHKASQAFEKGRKFLIKEMKLSSDGNEIFWEYKGQPHLTSTVWALEALQYSEHNQDFPEDRHNGIKEKAITWVLKTLPDFNSEEKWDPEVFFEYSTTKYKSRLNGSPKRFYSFMPYLITSLLKFNVSPFEQKVVSCIRWLLKEKHTNWAIDGYNSNGPCTFSAAMAINVIVNWLRYANENTYLKITRSAIQAHKNSSICDYCDNRVVEPIENQPLIVRPAPFIFAFLFSIFGAVSVVTLIFFFTSFAIGVLGNDDVVSVVKWVLLALFGASIGIPVKYYWTKIRIFFTHNHDNSRGLDQ